MDTTSILAIIAALVIAYFFIKLVVSPLIKAVLGVVVFLVIIYILQRYFNFNFDGIFGPLSKYLDIKNLNVNPDTIISQIGNYIKQLFKIK